MKHFFLFLLGLLPFITLATDAKKQAGPYFVRYERDSTVAADSGKVKIICHFNADYMKDPFELRYGFNGSDAVAPLTAETNDLFVAITPGMYIGQFYYDGHFGEIQTDSIEIKPGMLTVIYLRFRIYQETYNVKKPVIYLYPETDLEVSVDLKPAGELTFTYPDLQKGWKGTAHTDGSMTIGTRTYPYLFWEGEDAQLTRLADYPAGFVVKQDEVTAFLEKKLTEMGLNAKEKADFITFWGPIMALSDRGFAQFVFNEDYDQIAKISIQPAPQELFRVYLLWTPLGDGIELHPQPQVMKTVNRKGFYVIEWGGSELPSLQRVP